MLHYFTSRFSKMVGVVGAAGTAALLVNRTNSINQNYNQITHCQASHQKPLSADEMRNRQEAEELDEKMRSVKVLCLSRGRRIYSDGIIRDLQRIHGIKNLSGPRMGSAATYYVWCLDRALEYENDVDRVVSFINDMQENPETKMYVSGVALEMLLRLRGKDLVDYMLDIHIPEVDSCRKFVRKNSPS